MTYSINPKAIWYDGTPITWEDFHWQWRALNGTEQGVPDLVVQRLRGHRERRAGPRRSRGDRHLQEQVRRLAGALLRRSIPPRPTSRRRSSTTGGRARPLTTAGPFKFEQHRPDGQDRDARAQREVVGRAGQARPHRLSRHRPRRADRRARQRRDRLHGHRAGREQVHARQGDRRRRHPLGRRAELPAHHDQRHRARSCRTSRCARRWRWRIDRAAIARAMLGPLGIDAATLGNHIFMRNQTGYQDNSGDVGKYDPGPRRAAARRGRLEARRQRPEEGRPHAGDQLRDSERRSPRRGRSRS